MSDSCDDRSRSESAHRSGSSRRRNISISSTGGNNSPMELGRSRSRSRSGERSVIVSDFSNGTPTTSKPPDERPSPTLYPNPSFYRYEPIISHSAYTRRTAKGTVPTNTDEIFLWDEMNACENRDRDFEMRKPTNNADKAILAQDLKAEDERRNVWDEEHKKKGKSETESSSDLSTAVGVCVQEGSVGIGSVPPSSSSEAESKTEKEAGGGGLVGKFRRLRLRRTKVEAQATQVASEVC